MRGALLQAGATVTDRIPLMDVQFCYWCGTDKHVDRAVKLRNCKGCLSVGAITCYCKGESCQREAVRALMGQRE